MNEKNLVICDREFRYAEGLGENVSERSELALKVYTCTSLENVIQFQKKKNIHILIVDERFPYEERKKMEAEQIFILTKDCCEDLQSDEKEIYKYQSADRILAEIFEVYYEKTSHNILKSVRKTKHTLLAVYSPIHRIGKTAFAIALGKEMAKKEKTLYLNLEEYADVGGRFMCAEGRNLGDLLYFMRQEKGNFPLKLSNTLGKIEELDYIPPISCSMDLKEVSLDEWKCFLEQILQKSIYETIILDLSESVQGLFSILQMCDRIYMPILEDEISSQKLHRYEENLTRFQLEAILEKTYRFVAEDDIEEYAKKVIKEEWKL